MARDYEEQCGLAAGLDVVGERWALLIVREVLFGPKRFTDLLQGLPGIPPSLLSARLKELQETGIIRKEILPRPASSTVYQLTEAGRELEGILYALGRWGAQFGRTPRAGDAARAEWALFALRCAFRPEAAEGVHETYELRFPDGTVRLEVDGGVLAASLGPGSRPDLVLAGDMPTVMGVLMGRFRPETGTLRTEGNRDALARLVEMFRICELEECGPETAQIGRPQSMLELLGNRNRG